MTHVIPMESLNRLTVEQILKLENLGFKKPRNGKPYYQKFYGRGSAFAKCLVNQFGYYKIRGCLYQERLFDDIRELEKVGIK